VLGLANYGGGCIVVGVEQREDGTLDPVGHDGIRDKNEVSSALENFLPDTLFRQIETLDFSYEESEYPKLKDKSFQVLLVEDDPSHQPFIPVKDGASVSSNVIYTRRGASMVATNHEEFQRVVSRRLETGYSSRRELDLKTHLEQLRVLYEQVSPYSMKSLIGEMMLQSSGIHRLFTKRVPNPSYPEEDYETFLARAIARKKRRIEMELDIEDIPAPDTL
jgi:hypothetical protein